MIIMVKKPNEKGCILDTDNEAYQTLSDATDEMPLTDLTDTDIIAILGIIEKSRRRLALTVKRRETGDLNRRLFLQKLMIHNILAMLDKEEKPDIAELKKQLEAAYKI